MQVFSADLQGICRRSVAEQRLLFEQTPGSAERTVYEGIGEGGDRTLVIDRRCEDMVFAELEVRQDGWRVRVRRPGDGVVTRERRAGGAGRSQPGHAGHGHDF